MSQSFERLFERNGSQRSGSLQRTINPISRSQRSTRPSWSTSLQRGTGQTQFGLGDLVLGALRLIINQAPWEGRSRTLAQERGDVRAGCTWNVSKWTHIVKIGHNFHIEAFFFRCVRRCCVLSQWITSCVCMCVCVRVAKHSSQNSPRGILYSLYYLLLLCASPTQSG